MNWSASNTAEGTTLVSEAEKVKAGVSASSSSITEHDNHLYLYSDVTRDSAAQLNMKLMQMAKKLREEAFSQDRQPQPIHLHIQSNGGSMTAGFSISDTMLRVQRDFDVDIHTHIEGMCASAGTLISLVGMNRTMTANSLVLVHQLSSIAWGNFEELKDHMKNSEQFMRMAYSFYNSHTSIPAEELPDLMKHDLFWNAEKCMEYGIVDEVV